uniref:Tyrosine specific protein phosphatases domain-containing protein n=1 Tax=Neobodo designis TaxID=312471 RepID=A0A7S1M8E6_NEODS|mmetsp:Transcript_3597/g.11254  ORF Transcript_3597/g.11254 Transcript_3597/m.11254 type:complete len:743 (+) Transcript_3597:210-2438(+)
MSSDDELPALQRGSSDDEVDSDIAAARERLKADVAAKAAAGVGPGGLPADLPPGLKHRVTNPAANPDDVTDEDEDEEEKPYGKKAVKKMMAAMDKEVTLDFAAELEADEEGYKPITWTQLQDNFSYERVAHGFKLYGDISQKDREHWDRAKQVKIRDKDGREGAAFFYEEESKPHFDWDDVQIGNEIVVKSPRFHRFLDGQEGMRIEKNKSISRVAKRKFTDVQRLDYGRLNKTNGNAKYAKKKYDDAIGCYETAINHLQGTFHDHPEFEQEARELCAQCYLNIAACQIGQGRHRVVEVSCRSALRINASKALNAKAYFRIGQCALKLHELQPAKEALMKALDLAPGDSAVIAEINKLNEEIATDAKAQKELFDLQSKEKNKKFGWRRTVLNPNPPTEIPGVTNFRDVGGKMTLNPDAAEDDDEGLQRVPKLTLLRSAQLVDITRGGLHTLSDELRVKSILDLRTSSEVSAKRKMAAAKIAAYNKANELEIELYRKSNGERGMAPRALVDVESKFTPINVTCNQGTEPKLAFANKKAAAGKSIGEALEGPVVYHLDMTTRAVMSLASWWTLLQAVFWGVLAVFHASMLKRAAIAMLKGTALRVGVESFYETTLRKQGPEIAFAMKLAADEANYPILVHCSMGKDRTGIIVALLLSVAGVSIEDISKEYAAVTGAQPDEAELGPLGIDEEWRVARADVMLRTLKAVRDVHGGIDKYLESIGVDQVTQKKIRAVLSQKVKAKVK